MEPEFVGYPPQPDELEHHNLISQWRKGIRVWSKRYQEQAYMQEALQSDRMALRFLIARNMVVEDAITMFHECLEVRRAKNLDNILDHIRPVHRRIAMILPIMIHGFAKDGRPIVIEHTGHNRIAQAIGETSLEDVLEYHLIMQEFTMRKVLSAASKKAGKRIDSRYYIADLNGAGMDSLSKPARTYLSQISQDDAVVYPESLFESWVFHTGMIFTFCYALVKPFLPERTATKFRVFKGYPISDIEERLGLDTIPTYMGGNYIGENIVDYTREEGTQLYQIEYDSDLHIIWPAQVDPFGEKAAEEAVSRALANGIKVKKTKIKVDKIDRDFTEARMCAPWTEEFFYLLEHGLAAYEEKFEPEKAKIRAEKGPFAFAPEILLEEDPDSMTAGCALYSVQDSSINVPSTASSSAPTKPRPPPGPAPAHSKRSIADSVATGNGDSEADDQFEDLLDVSCADFEALKQEAMKIQENAK